MVREELLYRNLLYKNTNNFYGIEINIQCTVNINKLINKNYKNVIERNNTLNLNSNFFEKKEDNKVLHKLINLCMRKGNKKLAYKMIKKGLMLIRAFFWINPLLLLKMALLQIEPFIKLDKYTIRNREIIKPRFIYLNRRINYSLREIVKNAIKNKINYKYFYISLVHAIIEYSILNNTMVKKNQENNELAELNKFFLYKKKKKRRKMKVLKKIPHWKE